MEPVATNIESAIHSVLSILPKVRLAILFGSLATSSAHFGSDVDIAVDTGRPMTVDEKSDLINALAERTARPVDLIDLQTVGEPLLGQVLAHGRRLMGDDDVYAELLKKHLFAEADFMPYYRRILAERRSAWIRS